MDYEEKAVPKAATEKYLIFTVREKRYALPSKIIGEVAALEKIFPLPIVPDYIRGIINRYSVPYALIDLSFLLQRTASEAGKIIVLKEEIDKLALLIDDVTDIADVSEEQLIKTEQGELSAAGLVCACFEWKGNPVFCIDAVEIVNYIKQDFENQAS